MTPAQQQQQRMMRSNMMGQGMPGMNGTPFDATGTIETIAAGRIQMTDAAGTKRIIVVNNQTTFKTTGDAAADFLNNSGLCVQFKGEVDAKGNVSGKVDELTLVSVSKENTPGVYSESSGEAIKPASAKKGAAAPAGMSKIIGQISPVKGGKYKVQAGRTSVQLELGESPKISIDVTDAAFAARFASKGDKIEVKGVQSPNMLNQAQAQTVTITLAETLGAKKSSDAAKVDPKHPPKASKSKNGDKADGLPVPADDK